MLLANREIMVTSTVCAVVTPTATFIDDTIEVFLTPSPPKHTGNPNYSAIKDIHQLLTENAELVESNLIVRQNVYIGIILPPKQ